MKSTYTSVLNNKVTPQSKPIPGRESEMAVNNAGGYTFKIGPFDLLERFLILGSDAPTYYVNADKLTKLNADNIRACLKLDGKRTVDTIVEISVAGRAPKNDPALFALAVAASPKYSTPEIARYALDQLPKVARIGTHLFHFAQYLDGMRGWGRSVKSAFAGWYTEKKLTSLAYQALKYQQRDGWSHRDLLRKAHPKTVYADRNNLFKYIVDGEMREGLPAIVGAFEEAKKATDVKTIVRLIEDSGLTREMIPTQFLNEKAVWEALLVNMPMTAMVRNLGNMSKVGLLKPLSKSSVTINERLANKELVLGSKLHPLQILLAYGTYGTGHGFRGHGSWEVVPTILDALQEAFYHAFGNVVPTGKAMMYGVDCSGSMAMSFNGTNLTHNSIAAAMMMASARTEKNYASYGFHTGMIDVGVTKSDTLETAIRKFANKNCGGTDCAMPMIYAGQKGLEVDAFVVITDNETWAGRVQPVQALQQYRKARGKDDISLTVIGTAATQFSIADPTDRYMLDVAGFDAAAPILISDFIRGKAASVETDEDTFEA